MKNRTARRILCNPSYVSALSQGLGIASEALIRDARKSIRALRKQERKNRRK